MGAIKSRKCSRGHLMQDPNLFYRSTGVRECKKCKARRLKEWRIQQRKLKPKVAKPRKKLTIKQKIVKVGATVAEILDMGGEI